MTEDAVTVSSVLSYSKEEIDRPGGLRLVMMQKYTYSASDGLYIPIKHETDGQYAYHTTIYHYDTDGKLAEEIEVLYETECAELFRVLSNKRILLLQTKTPFDFSKVSLLMIDANGTVLFESPEFSFSESVQSYIDNNEHGIYVTNREDGTLRILVNAINRVYYFDESLALLSEVTLPAECTGITPLDDDVYMIGSEMPSVCMVDLKNGTAEFADVPVLPEMKYFSTFYCGGDDQLYCSYKDSIYLCQKDDTGSDSLVQLMNWYQGAFDGQGFYWIVNDTCMFYVPVSVQFSSMVVYILKLGSSPDVLNRRVLTFAALTDSSNVKDWYLDVISLFNERSKDYYIHYIYLSSAYNDGSLMDRLDAYLLDGNKPDMVLFPLNYYRKYAEKNLLLDLSADYADRLVAPAREAYTEGNGAMYALPLIMQLYTYACKSSLLDGPLTWDDMYALGDELKASDPGEHMALSTAWNEIDTVYYLLQNYVDYETKTSSFHSDDFHHKVRFKEEMAQYII